MANTSKQLRICGPFHSLSGYSHFARGVLRCALLAGFDVQAIESDPRITTGRFATDGHSEEVWDIQPPKTPLPDCQKEEIDACLQNRVDDGCPSLLLMLPENLPAWPTHQQYAPGPVIGYTMTESDNLSTYWRHGCRNVDYLLAPSQYVLDAFRRAVPEVPSGLLPIPVDSRLWEPEGYVEGEGVLRNRPPFLFLSIFQPSERKQWRQLLTAFTEEFCREREQVGLIVKPGPSEEVARMAGWCREAGAWVETDWEMRTDYMMSALYRACDVFVMPSSEGFGLPYVEAGLCGKPSIALSLSGSADVVDESCGYVCPAEMNTIPGHMLQWYPRHEHKFATCTIEYLRSNLRYAYDMETSGQSRAKAAQERMQAFTCEKIAPMLEAAVEEGAFHANAHRTYSLPPAKPTRAFVTGNWGDVFACMGKVKEYAGNSQIRVIFYGTTTQISDWIAQQPFVSEVTTIIEPNVEEFTRVYGSLCQENAYHAIDVVSKMLVTSARMAISPANVALCQLRLNEKETPQYWNCPAYSIHAGLWAHENASQIGKPFYLLNPYSVASNKMADHWEYWAEAIEWLLDETPCTFALVGERPVVAPEHPRLVNLSGQSRTMQDVLALAHRSEGIISTSNNLGIYAPIAGIPALIVCARTCHRRTFYHRWMETEGVTLLEFEDGPPWFGRHAKAFLGLTVQEPQELTALGGAK